MKLFRSLAVCAACHHAMADPTWCMTDQGGTVPSSCQTLSVAATAAGETATVFAAIGDSVLSATMQADVLVPGAVLRTSPQGNVTNLCIAPKSDLLLMSVGDRVQVARGSGVVVGSFPTVGHAGRIHVTESESGGVTAFVCSDELSVWDVSAAEVPVHLASVTLPQGRPVDAFPSPHESPVFSREIYASTKTGVQVVTWTNSTAALALGPFIASSDGALDGLDVPPGGAGGAMLYAAADGNGVATFDLVAQKEVARYPLKGWSGGVGAAGGVLFVASDPGLYAVDSAGGKTLATCAVNKDSSAGAGWNLAVALPYVFLANQVGGLEVIRVNQTGAGLQLSVVGHAGAGERGTC
jgi:hypothetical protein